MSTPEFREPGADPAPDSPPTGGEHTDTVDPDDYVDPGEFPPADQENPQ